MKALLTSCNRPDLLLKTLNSLYENQAYHLQMVINEDSKSSLLYTPGSIEAAFQVKIKFTHGAGQHGSIQKYLKETTDKFYLHLEDDWEFINGYDWITDSLAIMDNDPSVIKVLARKGSPHVCTHDHAMIKTEIDNDRFKKYGCDFKDSISTEQISYGYLVPWRNTDDILWHGFSWNPGVTRADLLREFMPFPKWEQDLSEEIYKKGYKVVELAEPVYEHIGEGRSTH